MGKLCPTRLCRPSNESPRGTEGPPDGWVAGWRHDLPTPEWAPSKRARKPQPQSPAAQISSPKFPYEDGWRQPRVPKVLATNLLISASYPQVLPEAWEPGLPAPNPPASSPSCSTAPSLSFPPSANRETIRCSDAGDGQLCRWDSGGRWARSWVTILRLPPGGCERTRGEEQRAWRGARLHKGS